MELIAAQYRGRARVLQAKLFVPLETNLKIWLEIGKSIEIKKRK